MEEELKIKTKILKFPIDFTLTLQKQFCEWNLVRSYGQKCHRASTIICLIWVPSDIFHQVL